jgi:putative transcriptional regulator
MKSKIGEIRKEKGLMQKYVAEKTKISQQLLSDYETGKAYPRIDKAFRIADFFNCKVDDLYERDE